VLNFFCLIEVGPATLQKLSTQKEWPLIGVVRV